MTHCCTTNNSISGKAVCPVNGQLYAPVSHRTVQHHVRQPWRRELTAQRYYFCDDPDCEVVYFGDNQQLILQAEMRQTIGQKSSAPDKPVCYCFDIQWADLQNPGELVRLKTYVTEQTRTSACDCEIRNPSGKCCLRDFPDQ